MTNREILIQIIHETTGEAKEKINEKIEFTQMLAPNKKLKKLDEEVPDAEALLNKLRQEKVGILLFFIKGDLENLRRFDA